MLYRCASLILILGLPLASCGGASDPRGNLAGFDRARYRSAFVEVCREGTAEHTRQVPPEVRAPYCECMADRLVAARSDDELRAFERDDVAARREIEAALPHCAGPNRGRPPAGTPPTDGSEISAAAVGSAIPRPAPNMAIVRNRAGRALTCTPPGGQTEQLDDGADYDVGPGLNRCTAPVRPGSFGVVAGHVYDLVPEGDGVIVRDVTPAP